MNELNVDDKEEQDIGRDKVEHDRCDHLTCSEARLQIARDEGPSGAPNHAKEHHHQDRKWCGCRPGTEHERRDRSTDRSHGELSCATNVEDARAECNRNPEAHKDERDRGDHALHNWSQRTRPDVDVAIGLKGPAK